MKKILLPLVFLIVFFFALSAGMLFTRYFGQEPSTGSNTKVAVPSSQELEDVLKVIAQQLEDKETVKYHVAVFDEYGELHKEISSDDPGLVETVDRGGGRVEYNKGISHYEEVDGEMQLIRVQGKVTFVDKQLGVVVVVGDDQMRRYVYLSSLIPVYRETFTQEVGEDGGLVMPKREVQTVSFDDIYEGAQISINTERIHGRPSGMVYIIEYN